VRVFHTTGSFTDAADLVRRVRARLVEIASDDLAPWVKLGVVVFHADRLIDRGSQVRVEATVRDPAVAEALVALRSDQWRSPSRWSSPITPRAGGCGSRA
jgi:hypothetical protein